MKQSVSFNAWLIVGIVVGFSFFSGYLVGFLLKDVVFTSDVETAIMADMQNSNPPAQSMQQETHSGRPKLPGDTVHTLLTSSGDGYQNFQTRLMYASYLLVQKMPEGEKMTGFTRILHRTVPDLLMEEVPTFHVWDVIRPECDGWCDYPVANRPNAIMQFFRAAAKDHTLIKGAWVVMTECDYIWMKPARAPGDAYDRAVPGLQYFFDYIMPQHPDAAPYIQKLFGKGKDINEVPASGPAPVMIRFDDWLVIGSDYERMSFEMEADAAMVKQLGWVREMYAWDVACALHPEIKIVTDKPPSSTLMVQAPFDEGVFNASFVHYTWGAIYHEGLASKGGKQVYRWEKRDWTDIKHALKPQRIPMPPDFKPGWTLPFDAPLTLPRHNMVVAYLTQLNKAIDTLSDLTDYHKKVEEEIIPEFRKNKSKRIEQQVNNQIRYMPWSLPVGDVPIDTKATQ